MKAAISIGLSVLTVLTLWIGVTLLIFPPIAAYLGWRNYKDYLQKVPAASRADRALALLPLLAAVAVFVGGFWMLNTQYNA